MSSARTVTYIHGPQASGKTRLALKLAAGDHAAHIYDEFEGRSLPRGAGHVIVISLEPPERAWLPQITNLIALGRNRP